MFTARNLKGFQCFPASFTLALSLWKMSLLLPQDERRPPLIYGLFLWAASLRAPGRMFCLCLFYFSPLAGHLDWLRLRNQNFHNALWSLVKVQCVKHTRYLWTLCPCHLQRWYGDHPVSVRNIEPARVWGADVSPYEYVVALMSVVSKLLDCFPKKKKEKKCHIKFLAKI